MIAGAGKLGMDAYNAYKAKTTTGGALGAGMNALAKSGASSKATMAAKGVADAANSLSIASGNFTFEGSIDDGNES